MQFSHKMRLAAANYGCHFTGNILHGWLNFSQRFLPSNEKVAKKSVFSLRSTYMSCTHQSRLIFFFGKSGDSQKVLFPDASESEITNKSGGGDGEQQWKSCAKTANMHKISFNVANAISTVVRISLCVVFLPRMVIILLVDLCPFTFSTLHQT